MTFATSKSFWGVVFAILANVSCHSGASSLYKTDFDIAKALFVSEKTVKNHLTNIFRKLNVNDRTQALIYVLKNKIVSLD